MTNRVLEEVDNILENRNNVHGDSFDTIARLWSVYLTKAFGKELTVSDIDVCLMMELMKLARIMTAEELNKDSFLDGIGYMVKAVEKSFPFEYDH